MSETLRIILKGCRLNAAMEHDMTGVLERLAQQEFAASRRPIRLVFRSEGWGATIEPFLGSASVEALLRIRRKQAQALGLLSKLVACGFLFCDDVSILLMSEGGAEPSEQV